MLLKFIYNAVKCFLVIETLFYSASYKLYCLTSLLNMLLLFTYIGVKHFLVIELFSIIQQPNVITFHAFKIHLHCSKNAGNV